eukprot:TRINITY_DN2499_c0_g1_i1.p1 TRINITY_DN2499_c0_g1~~TRINITY_DN2499_c0_g1_i1.p1  ORF type:complete len:473 (+),score=52.21 TRINITY_DN2499_c0_g1_i1:56-1474(+)
MLLRVFKLLSIVVLLFEKIAYAGKVSSYLRVWWDSYNETVQPTTFKKVNEALKCYNNPWMHTSRFYAVLDPPHYNDEMQEGFSSLTAMSNLYVTDLKASFHNFKTGYLWGVTLAIDFPMPWLNAYMDHWAELVFPIFSVLTEGLLKECSNREHFRVDRVLLLNIDKKQLSDWHDSVLLMALYPATEDNQNIKMLDMNDFTNLNKQLWMGFETVAVVTDRYTEPNRNSGFPSYDHGDAWKHQGSTRYINPTWSGGFLKKKHGQKFRNMAYQTCQLPEPKKHADLPKKITWIFPDDGNEISNMYELMELMENVGEEFGWKVRPITLSGKAPFCSHVSAMAETGVLVGRYNPLMVDAVFMPPGGVVLELLPYNWEWQNISALHYNLTRSVGDLTHIAWRAVNSQHADYKRDHDRLYKGWLLDECSVRECLHAHARAGLLVDVVATENMLRMILESITKGDLSQLLQIIWPIDNRV